jgi:DNA repair protein RadC
MHQSAIHALPRALRPREKLMRYGPDKLSDGELLSVILRTGRQGKGVLALAEAVLKYGGLKKLAQAGWFELKASVGIGTVQALELVACAEIGKRMFDNKKTRITQLLSPADVFVQLHDIRFLKKEHFIALYLDSRNQQIQREVISVGSLTASIVHPREVFEPAVRHIAAQIIIAHNHPSGDVAPSEADLEITRRLVEAGTILGIDVVDHIIVSANGFLSFKEKKLM